MSLKQINVSCFDESFDELFSELAAKIDEAKTEIIKWIGFMFIVQTVILLGGVYLIFKYTLNP